MWTLGEFNAVTSGATRDDREKERERLRGDCCTESEREMLRLG